ncbi:phosphate/phosphite/phosphonate ABC transporter substrate-binding protein [candidate division CSSED10-310 bacterium]|uniref:Phosphate/phosphite/phosphonate ABC transporter substrate-binding protein n=1 Tax=candidate division CSSED10-310 bacterium TaxID=2855610 RepID=A0ABV6YYB5_UNCC1
MRKISATFIRIVFILLITAGVILLLTTDKNLAGAETDQVKAEKQFFFIYYYPDAPVLTPFDIFDNIEALSLVIERSIPGKTKVVRRLFKRREDFQEYLPTQLPDFLIIDPIFWVQMEQREVYTPLLVMNIDNSTSHTKKLIVSSDSPIKSLKDMQGKNLATTLPFTAENEILSNLYFQSFINPSFYFQSIKRVDNSGSALLSVLYRDAAGALIPSYLKGLKEDHVVGKIRPIFESKSILNGIFAVNKNTVSTTIREAIKKRFLNLRQTREGKKTLAKLRISTWATIDPVSLLDLSRRCIISRWHNTAEIMEAHYLTPPVDNIAGPKFPAAKPVFTTSPFEPGPMYDEFDAASR